MACDGANGTVMRRRRRRCDGGLTTSYVVRDRSRVLRACFRPKAALQSAHGRHGHFRRQRELTDDKTIETAADRDRYMVDRWLGFYGI